MALSLSAGLALTVSPETTPRERSRGQLGDAAFPADENSAAVRPLASLCSGKYPDDKLTKPITGLATKNKAKHKAVNLNF